MASPTAIAVAATGRVIVNESIGTVGDIEAVWTTLSCTPANRMTIIANNNVTAAVRQRPVTILAKECIVCRFITSSSSNDGVCCSTLSIDVPGRRSVDGPMNFRLEAT